MTSEEYAVILPYATSHAIRAEKVLKNAGVPSKMIPVPRHISSSCGVCVRIGRADREVALRALEQVGLEIEGVHEI